MVSLGALGRESVLALILGSNYPDISISVPDICKVFPVNFLREFCEKSLRHSSFSLGTYLQEPRNREIPCKFPCYQGIANGDRFVSDCFHHHPVLANHAFPTRRQIGRFCADFRVLNSWIFVSVGVRAFVDDFWRPVSASKNSVPGGRACARSPGVWFLPGTCERPISQSRRNCIAGKKFWPKRPSILLQLAAMEPAVEPGLFRRLPTDV